MPMKTKDEQKAYQREWIRQRRQDWIEANGPCKCGSSDRLEVDHIDPNTKSMNPSQIWSRCEEVRETELAKCQVLCYECHKQKTAVDLRARFEQPSEHGDYLHYRKGCKCEFCMEAMRLHWRSYRASKRGKQ